MFSVFNVINTLRVLGYGFIRNLNPKIYLSIFLTFIFLFFYLYIIILKNEISNLESRNWNLEVLNRALRDSEIINREIQKIKDSQNIKTNEKIKEIQTPLIKKEILGDPEKTKQINLKEIELKDPRILDTLNSLNNPKDLEKDSNK